MILGLTVNRATATLDAVQLPRHDMYDPEPNHLRPGSDGRLRCQWCVVTSDYQHYHDHEWGWPVTDDRRLFEKLCLEGFQAGLSWRTILAKREHFRAAFLGFDFDRLTAFGPADVDRLLQDAGIVRHRGKIEAVLNNAHRAGELVAEAGSLAAFVWRFEPVVPPAHVDGLRSVCEESVRLSAALKKRGWKFVGPTTIYAFMQAMGMVNDHFHGCMAHEPVEGARRALIRPASSN